MPAVVQRLSPPSSSWFGIGRVAHIVRLSVGQHLTVRQAGAKLKASPRELREAQEMREDWDGEVALKVRRAIEISNGWGLGRKY